MITSARTNNHFRAPETVPKITIVPTHLLRSDTKNVLKHEFEKDSKNLTKLLTKNDLKLTTKCDASNAPKNKVSSLNGTLTKSNEKNIVQYELKTLQKTSSNSDLKNDLKSLSDLLPKQAPGNGILKNDTQIPMNSEAINRITPEKVTNARKRLESMSDDEIIQENIKEILEKKSREERKANGRFVAVSIAILVIVVAIYNAFKNSNGALSGALVPVAIMLSYGGGVVILAKRDKQRKALFEKQLEEVTQRNKAELAAKAKLQKKKSETSLHYEHEKLLNGMEDDSKPSTSKARRKRKHRTALGVDADGRVRRPSIRDKLFRQRPPQLRPSTNLLPLATTAAAPSQIAVMEARPKRMDTLKVPQPLVRIGSVP